MDIRGFTLDLFKEHWLDITQNIRNYIDLDENIIILIMDRLLSDDSSLIPDDYKSRIIHKLCEYYGKTYNEQLFEILIKYIRLYDLKYLSQIEDIRAIIFIMTNWTYITYRLRSGGNFYKNLFNNPYLYEIDHNVMNDKYQQLNDIIITINYNL
jgi:hypothetical protein